MNTSHKLLEYGYQDIFGGIDWSFINMKQHYDTIRDMGLEYKGLPYDDIVEFSADSEEHPSQDKQDDENRHAVYIQMMDLEKELQNPAHNSVMDAVAAAVAGDLLVHCDCKAYLYWGYQYIADQLGFAMYDFGHGEGENWNGKKVTEPKIYYKTDPQTGKQVLDKRRTRNYQQKGTVCKHIANALKVFPFWTTTIASELMKRGYTVEPSTIEVPVEPQQVEEPPEAELADEETPEQEVPDDSQPQVPEVGEVPQRGPEEPTAQPARSKKKKKKRKKPQQAQQQADDPFGIRQRIIKNLLYPENMETTSFEKLVEAELLESTG